MLDAGFGEIWRIAFLAQVAFGTMREAALQTTRG